MNIASTRSISQYADHLRQKLLDHNDKMAIFELAQALIAINADYNMTKCFGRYAKQSKRSV